MGGSQERGADTKQKPIQLVVRRLGDFGWRMSRRKQPKPRHVDAEDDIIVPGNSAMDTSEYFIYTYNTQCSICRGLGAFNPPPPLVSSTFKF